MSKSVRPRRLIALIAAYVVALQALLLPLTVVAAGPFASAICAAEASHAPASHETGCPCAAGCGMQCCAQALIGPPQAVVTLALNYKRVTAETLAFAPNVRPTARGPQLARAPPAA